MIKTISTNNIIALLLLAANVQAPINNPALSVTINDSPIIAAYSNEVNWRLPTKTNANLVSPQLKLAESFAIIINVEIDESGNIINCKKNIIGTAFEGLADDACQTVKVPDDILKASKEYLDGAQKFQVRFMIYRQDNSEISAIAGQSYIKQKIFVKATYEVTPMGSYENCNFSVSTLNPESLCKENDEFERVFEPFETAEGNRKFIILIDTITID